MHLDAIDLLPMFMFASLAVLLFSGFPVAFILGGIALVFGSIGIFFDIFKPVEFFLIVSRIYGGVMNNAILVAIPMFVFMGTMLERSGVAHDLLYSLQVLTRRLPGGLAISVTLLGTIMAAATGIIGASVVMITLLALPVMLERGYDKSFASGTIAASGTLGILIPPSIMLVVMAELMSISVGSLFVAAIVPGLLLSGLYLIYIFFIAWIRPAYAPPLPPEAGPENALAYAGLMIRSFLPPLLLIMMVLGSIFLGIATPTEAASVGAFGAIMLALLKKNLSGRILKLVCERSALTGAMLFGIFIGATAFSYVFRVLGGDDLVLGLIDQLSVGPWSVLMVLMAIIFLLGFFFDWIEITLIVLPIFTPILKLLDFSDHIAHPAQILPWFAILVAVNLQTSFLTPPFGFALFYMKGVAPPDLRITQIYRGIWPFVLLQILGLAMIMAFPQLALWLPSLVFG